MDSADLPDRVVADLGNTRLKWARLAPDGTLGSPEALDLERLEDWTPVGLGWAIGSVNPPALGRLRRALGAAGIRSIRVYASASDVPVRHELEAPGRAGADRGLAVLGALGIWGAGPGVVASCGTAITVERIGPDGTWLGGAIAAGLRPMARALHDLTAQLPRVDRVTGSGLPPTFGRSTAPAIEAGLAWGLVGAVRELVGRARAELGGSPWVAWTGGDAPWLAPAVEGPDARVVPDLVLRGLASAAFGAGASP
jgi:type III pantothenate kinase